MPQFPRTRHASPQIRADQQLKSIKMHQEQSSKTAHFASGKTGNSCRSLGRRSQRPQRAIAGLSSRSGIGRRLAPHCWCLSVKAMENIIQRLLGGMGCFWPSPLFQRWRCLWFLSLQFRLLQLYAHERFQANLPWTCKTLVC